MKSILTTARIVCKNTPAREKAIEAFRKIIEYTTPNEPDVLQYVCAVPYHDNLGSEIYMIEEYANQAASDAHLATKPVQELIQLFTTGDVLAQPPEVHHCPVVSNKALSSGVSASSEPAIVLMNISSKSNPSATLMRRAETIAERASGVMRGLDKLVVVEDKESKSVRMECVLQDWNAFVEFQKTVVRDEPHTAEVVPIRPVCGFINRKRGSKL